MRDGLSKFCRYTSLSRYLAVCGILAPVLFIAFVIIGASVTPGYSHVADAISQLASEAAPHPEWMNAGFISYGVLMIGLAYALKQVLPTGVSSKMVWFLVVIHGICFILTAVFPDDPGKTNTAITLTGILHHVVSIAGCLAFIIGILLFFKIVSAESTWQNLSRLYLFAVFIVFILFIASLIPIVREIEGLVQRVSALVMAFFIELLSIKCLALSVGSPKRRTNYLGQVYE